jgi:hypothetical protein
MAINQAIVYSIAAANSFPQVPNVSSPPLQYDEGESRSYHIKVENTFLVTDMESEFSAPAPDVIDTIQRYDLGRYSEVPPEDPFDQKYSLTGYYESKTLERGPNTRGWMMLAWTQSGVTEFGWGPNVMVQYKLSNIYSGGEWTTPVSAVGPTLIIKDGTANGSRKKYFKFRFLWFTEEWTPTNISELAKIKDVAVLII